MADEHEIARLCEELAAGRSLEVKLFATELAGRIRARAIKATDEKVTIAEASKLLGVCKLHFPRLVAEGALPQPDEYGRFLRHEIERVRAWIGPFMAKDQLERLARLSQRARA